MYYYLLLLLRTDGTRRERKPQQYSIAHFGRAVHNIRVCATDYYIIYIITACTYGVRVDVIILLLFLLLSLQLASVVYRDIDYDSVTIIIVN